MRLLPGACEAGRGGAAGGQAGEQALASAPCNFHPTTRVYSPWLKQACPEGGAGRAVSCAPAPSTQMLGAPRAALPPAAAAAAPALAAHRGRPGAFRPRFGVFGPMPSAGPPLMSPGRTQGAMAGGSSALDRVRVQAAIAD